MTVVDTTTGEVVQTIPADQLHHGPPVRGGGIDPNHIDELSESIDALPPILVRDVDGRYEILDGHHRCEVHREAHGPTALVPCHVIECDDVQAYRLAVEANTTHGLPLTLGEKKNTAKHLLELSPDLSDREVAKVCGLSNKTVGALRSTGENPQLNGKRASGDGKQRPTKAKAQEQRKAAEKYVVDNPEATTADVVEATGVSAGTASNVKRQLTHAEQFDAAVELYPFLADLPEQYRREAIAGVTGLDQFDSTERPRREATFRKWAESRHEAAADAAATALTRKAEHAGNALLDAIAVTHRELSAWLTRHGDLPVGHELDADVSSAAADLIASLSETVRPQQLRSVK